jgi:hypothetical protein
VLHLALGIIIAVEGALNLIHAFSAQTDHLLMAFGAAEATGAPLFMWPRTILVGGCLLFCTFVIAAVVHVSGGEFPSEHLVYAVAVLFVMTRGRDSRESREPAPGGSLAERL